MEVVALGRLSLPHDGATPNFVGDTSAFYLGLAWQVSLSSNFLDNLTNDFSKRLWVSGGLSAAVHTGPLEKNVTDCRLDNDCGFGRRVLPRLQLEIGATFWKNHGLSVFVDHMSGGGAFGASQNEGIDHSGIRYHFFQQSVSGNVMDQSWHFFDDALIRPFYFSQALNKFSRPQPAAVTRGQGHHRFKPGSVTSS